MDKKFWGPSTWCTIHTAAAGYNPENMLSFKQFIFSLPYLLPCQYCREHLQHNLRTLPLTDDSLSNNKLLLMWTFFLHDLVNKQLKRFENTPSYSAVETFYFKKIGDNKFWGPCFWRTIHSFAASYRPTPHVKKAFKQFIYSLHGIIPCRMCREHYSKNLQQLPLTDEYLKNSHNLFLWSYLLHDLVNKQLNKVSPSFESVKIQYFNDTVCKSCG